MKAKIGVLLVVGLLTSFSAFSEIVYELISNDGSEALAQLELTSMPAGVSEVKSLSLTSAGVAAFASFAYFLDESTYTTPIRGFGEFVMDGDTGLNGKNPGLNTDFANVLFSATGFRDRGDKLIPIINIEARADGDSQLIEVATEDSGEFSISGNWQLSKDQVLTPEPASYLLFALGIVAVGYIKTRRRPPNRPR